MKSPGWDQINQMERTEPRNPVLITDVSLEESFAQKKAAYWYICWKWLSEL